MPDPDYVNLRIVARPDYEHLLLEHTDKVFHVVLCMVGNREDAEDVMQDVFLKAYKHLDDFRGAADVGTWLYSIAMNTARAHLRSRNRARRRTASRPVEELDILGRLPAAPDRVETEFDRQQISRALHQALQSLPPEFREVFVLKNIRGYSYKQIADILGISMGTVESRLFRAREKLRKDLRPHL